MPGKDDTKSGESWSARFHPRRDPGWLAIVALAALLGLALFRPWIHGADGVRYYAYLRSIAFDRDLDFENEFRHYPDSAPLLREWHRDPDTGRLTNAVACGSAVMWAPWLAIAHAVVATANAAGADVPADGYSRPYVVAVCLGSTIHALAGLLLLYATLRRWFAWPAALTAVVGLWLASPLVFYMYAHPSMSHANSFLAVCALFAACARWGQSRSVGPWAAMGALAGLAMLTRFNNLFWIAVPGANWLALLARAGRQRPEAPTPTPTDPSDGRPSRDVAQTLLLGLVFAAGALVAFSPQMAAWRAMHGSFLAGPRDYKLSSWPVSYTHLTLPTNREV